MELQKLSKLQIRAEVQSILQSFENYADTSSEEKQSHLATLKRIDNRNDVLDILVKELPRVKPEKLQLVTYLLIELGNLDYLKKPLWDIIKSFDVSDYIKEQAATALKGLGDSYSPEEFLSCLSDPKSVIDKETQKLLEIAAFNPDAQIDFLDFLFSLPATERKTLIQSLKADYSDDNLANVLVPALMASDSDELTEFILKILSESKSVFAVQAIKDISEFSHNEKLRKIAGRLLSEYKLAGIDINEDKSDIAGSEICKISKIYKCYVCIPDGTGCQGVIVSRKKDNGDILLLCVVISDTDGILDCFGFNGITLSDFNNILNRVQSEYSRIEVSADYCKTLLAKASHLNKVSQEPVPYEYLAWKSLLFDAQMVTESVEETVSKWFDEKLNGIATLLYEYPDFDHWFFDENDNPQAKEMMAQVILESCERFEEFVQDPENYIHFVNSCLMESIDKIFTKDVRILFCKRLLNSAILFNFAGHDRLRNLAATVGITIQNSNDTESVSSFLVEFLRRTIFEAFLRREANLEKVSDSKKTNIWNLRKDKTKTAVKQVDSDQLSLEPLISILEEEWGNNAE